MSYPVWDWPNSVITRVIDGDTLIARLTRDIGFHGVVTFEQRLRLNRINAAPAATPAGEAATVFLQSLLPPTAPFRLQTVKPYKYGDEWMAEITLPNGTNISDTLVAAGYAVHWDGAGPRPGEAVVSP